MRIGYQGEPYSYSYRAVGEIFPDDEPVGFTSFVAAFDALDDETVEKLQAESSSFLTSLFKSR